MEEVEYDSKVLGLSNWKEGVANKQYEEDYRWSGFVGKIRNSFLNMVTLRCLLDIQSEIACWQVGI